MGMGMQADAAAWPGMAAQRSEAAPPPLPLPSRPPGRAGGPMQSPEAPAAALPQDSRAPPPPPPTLPVKEAAAADAAAECEPTEVLRALLRIRDELLAPESSSSEPGTGIFVATRETPECVLATCEL